VELLMRRAGLAGVTGRPKWRRANRTRSPSTWSTASSPGLGRISCGSPISPSTPPGRASSTARWCWMRSPVGWWAGPLTPHRRRRW
jgi:hypothetical protein